MPQQHAAAVPCRNIHRASPLASQLWAMVLISATKSVLNKYTQQRRMRHCNDWRIDWGGRGKRGGAQAYGTVLSIMQQSVPHMQETECQTGTAQGLRLEGEMCRLGAVPRPAPRNNFANLPWKGPKAGFHTQLTEDMSLQSLRLPQVRGSRNICCTASPMHAFACCIYMQPGRQAGAS